MKRLIRDLALWINFYPLRFFVQLLPRRSLVKFSRFLGSISYILRVRRKKWVTREISLLLHEECTQREMNLHVRNSMQLTMQVSLESHCFTGISSKNIEDWMTIRDNQYLDNALERGRGAVLILVHFGANQLIMAALGYRGYQINQIGSAPDDWHRMSGIAPTQLERKVFDIRLASEKALPATFVYISKSMRPVFECLKRNEIMLLAVDGRAGSRFVSVPVCNRIMNVSQGPFRIAFSTKAALIPVFPIFDGKNYHTLMIEPELLPPASLDEKDWIEEAARLYAERLSLRLRQNPDHYGMLMAEARRRSSIDPVPLFEDFRTEGQQ